MTIPINPTENIGEVTASTPCDVVDFTPTLDIAGAYADGNVLFENTPVPNFYRIAGGIAMITDILVLDEDDEGGAFDLFFFVDQQNIGAVNAALAMTDTEARELLGWVRITAADYTDMGDQKFAHMKPSDSGWHLGLLKADAGDTSLYVAGVSRDTKTFTAATDLKLKFSVLHA